MGPHVGEELRRDRRSRSDGAGGVTTRVPATWEEAHEVLVELESIRAGTNALVSTRASGAVDLFSGAFGDSQFDGGGGKPKGKGKGKSNDGKGKGDGLKPICFEMRDKGAIVPAVTIADTNMIALG